MHRRPRTPRLSSPLLLVALWAALATAGCYGGQGGDDGLSTTPGPGQAAAEGAMECTGDPATAANASPDDDYRCHGMSDAGTGFDCNCAGEAVHSDAATCEDALREACGVEPQDTEELPPSGEPAGDLPPPSNP